VTILSDTRKAMPSIIITGEAHAAATRAFEPSPEEEAEQLPDGTWRLLVTQEEIDDIKPLMRPGETYSDVLIRAARRRASHGTGQSHTFEELETTSAFRASTHLS
jgi:hypothetical protein